MKYPQLVPTRAVNAISDWLVTRLEQLGVDSPHIYTRLLLSLLQSTVQINDPNEFNNLETFLANRKGSNRRYLACDTDTLKKLNAVQCLQSIVSTEQDISTIENLVDELCEKLKEIEKQNSDDIQEDSELGAIVTTVANINKEQQQQQQEQQPHQQQNLYTCIKHHNKKEENLRNLSDGNGATSIETDPKKRYFRAFPALTKEMEDSFRLWRRNAKSLTWPVNRSNISLLQANNNKSSKHTTLNIVENSESSATAVYLQEEKGAGVRAREVFAAGVNNTNDNLNYLESVYDNNVAQVTAAASGGVKRKSKRRRNQALPKGKTNQNIRKNSIGSTATTGGRGGGEVAGAIAGGRYHRNSSPAYWDTDFEGCWEMGRDLIKEFIMKQNKGSNNRNRSTSESAAYNMLRINDEEDEEVELQELQQLQQQQRQQQRQQTRIDTKGNSSAEEEHSKLISPFMPPVDISFCCDDEDYDNMHGSVPDMTLSASSVALTHRRLYQRDAFLISPKALNPFDMLHALQKPATATFGLHDADSEADADGGDVADVNADIDANDFAKFKAKFNSSVEALWKNNDLEDKNNLQAKATPKMLLSDIGCTVAPFKENLRNFWTNYLSNQQFEIYNNKAPYPDERGSMSLSCSGSYTNDVANTSDYYSMPNNFDDFDKSVGSHAALSGNATNVFLQNSIWSNNSQNSSGDTDESFYFKVWNSNKKLDAMHGIKLSNYGIDSKQPQDETYILPTYKASSKWSEGINAGPHIVQQIPLQHPMQLQQPQQQQLCLLVDNNASSIGTDYTDSSTTVSLTSSWQTPVACNQYNNLQPDLQSWSASNPISLTEMYESSVDTIDSSNVKTLTNASETATPVVTLPNHCSQTSSFVDYARVKRVLKPRAHEVFMQRQQYVAQLMLRPRERFPDNENLLTSPRTHFNPINSFIDGHTFEITSSLDVIEYQRSASGCRYLDDDKYVEYVRNDCLLGDDDVNIGVNLSATASTTPLYASSNCDAATARKTAVNDNFIIRFALRNCDVACQTDENILEQTQLKMMSFEKELLYHQQQVNISLQHTPPEQQLQQDHQQHPLYMIFAGAGQNMPLQNNTLACNDAIQALNKAVAAAAKASAADNNNRAWVPTTTVGCDMDKYRASQNAWNRSHSHIKKLLDDNNDELEEIERCNLAQQRQWSMLEIGKQCMLKGHHKNYNCNSINQNNNNNNIINNNNNFKDNNHCIDGLDDRHSLWSMCAACNSEYKSVPANRLLRDELQLEADEIMSDLKYMQDLYIGRSPSSLDEHADGDGEGQVSAEKSGQNKANTSGDGCLFDYDEPMTVAMESNSAKQTAENDMMSFDESHNRNDQHAVIQKVNQLIVDLLCPENKANIVQLENNDKMKDATWYANDNPKNAWQENINSEILKPMDLIRHFTNEPIENDAAEKNKQLLWEHSNLAEIWSKNTITPEAQLIKVYGNDDMNLEVPNIAESTKTQQQEPITVEENLPIDFKVGAMKSDNNATTTLKACIELDSQSKCALSLNSNTQNVAVSSNAFKRIQQFLNSNATANAASKLKLANRKRRHSASQNYFYQTTTTVAAATMPENNNKLQSTTDATLLNYFINNNNNSIDAKDLNSFNLKVKNLANNFVSSSSNVNGLGMKCEEEDLNRLYAAAFSGAAEDGDILMEQQQQQQDQDQEQPKQTIITCKYWTTTLEPTNLIDLSTTVIGNDQMDDVNDGGDVGGDSGNGNGNGDNDGDGGGSGGGTTFSSLIDKNARILNHVTMLARPLTR